MSLINMEDKLTPAEMENIMAGSGFGDCMSDVYGEHGGLSAWIWVQTAFIPETGAAFAIACYLKNR